MVALAMGVALALAGLAALAAGWTDHAPAAIWWLALALWTVGSLDASPGPASWPRLPRIARWVLGLLALWAACGLPWPRRGSSASVVMLSVMCLVWMADIAAYFGGRALGRRKLAPTISPGKSWRGSGSGAAGRALAGGVLDLA